MTQLPEWAPPDLDVTRPSAARVYDYFLGGAHNFEVDRQLAERVAELTPRVGDIMRANRAFLRRAVSFLLHEGIRQFIDIGSGIPTVGNVHEVAQAVSPEARVVYVDVDPIAVAHSRSILRGNRNTAVICADLRDPHRILDDTRASGLIDFSRPFAILLTGVVHFIPDSDDPAEKVEPLREALSSGSFLVISHVTADDQPPEVIEAQALSSHTDTEISLRSRAEVARYFDGLSLVEPGLVHIGAWRPDSGDEPDDHPERLGAYAGIGRKG